VEGCTTDEGGQEFTGVVRDGSEAIAGVRCCDMSGMTCSTRAQWCDEGYFTHDQATALCESAGLRLCTRGEMNNCCGVNSGCDDHGVWSSTPGSIGDQDCVHSPTPGPDDCTSDCGTLHQEVLSPEWGDGMCLDTIDYVCQPGDGDCPANVDCVMGPAPTYYQCTSECGTLTQTIQQQPSGQGQSCPTPITVHCQPGDGGCPIDQECVMGSVPTAHDCLSDCGTLTQEIITQPSGSGSPCPTPITHVCQPGEGTCPIDQDCVMGPAVHASDCTVNCGVLTQYIYSQPSGQGAPCATPMVFECQPGDGQCPANTDCVMGPDPTPADCSYNCGTITQQIEIPQSGTGADCPSHASTYECQIGDGLCGLDGGASSVNTGGSTEGFELTEQMMYIIIIATVGLLFIIAVSYLIYCHYKTRKAMSTVGRFTRVELQDLDGADPLGELGLGEGDSDEDDADEKDAMLGGLSWSPGDDDGI